MAVNKLLLSTLISRMQTSQSVETIEEQFLVRSLDNAIRANSREVLWPWTLRQGTLKVFRDVLIYPIASDHKRLAFFQTENAEANSGPKIDPRYTSIKEFFRNPTSRDDITEILDQGERFLGVRVESLGQSSQVLDQAEDASVYTASDDASSPILDKVTVKRGNSSVKVTITSNSGTATVKNTFTSFSDSNYKQKYHFKWIYLDAVPTNIEMRFQTDDSNYLSTTVTTQFSGQAFKADQWNLVAHDLNAATETGTFDSTAITSEKMVLTGAATGTYFFDESNSRQWEQVKYWYYSDQHVALTGSSVADQEYFFNSSDVYTTDSSLVGDEEWIDVVMYEALVDSVTELENPALTTKYEKKLAKAQKALINKYPDLVPRTTTYRRLFRQDYNRLDNRTGGRRHVL